MSPRLWFLLTLVAAALAACGGGDDAVEVSMLDNSFDPSEITIEAGQAVRFVNDGAVEHNAIAYDESWSTEDTFGELLMGPEEATEVTFDEPGVYPYFCSLHATRLDDGTYAGMVGTVTVTEGEAAPAGAVVAGVTEFAQEDTEDETEPPGNEPEEPAEEVPTPTPISAELAPSEWSGVTIEVPADYPTIQSAVDAAGPGDLVLVEPGVYRESVTVTTPGLTIRGTDRNEVILDGEFTRENGFFVIADGVALENMTARNYTTNGFFWFGEEGDELVGYRGSYLTAVDNWVYGIYAFGSIDGLFEHSYASGSWDSGFYIGQCDPCKAVITDVLAEYNGLGYSGTNSSKEIFIVNSEWRFNHAGVVPNSLDSEALPPVNNVYVGGNYIHHNGVSKDLAPYRTAPWSAHGNGVVLAGAEESTVEQNLIVNNPSSGVMVVSNIDANLWPSRDNVVRDNEILGSGRADVSIGGPLASGSCLAGDNGDSTIPMTAGFFQNCDGFNLATWWGLGTASEPLGRIVEYNLGGESPLEHGDAPDPELAFESLPGGADAPVRPAVDVFASLDFDPASVTTPDLPGGIDLDDRDLVILGVNVQAGLWPVVMGALLWWVPLAVWALGGLWALSVAWRRDTSPLEKALWTLLVVGLPVVGVLLFALFGNRDNPVGNRWIGVGSFLVVWLGATAAVLIVGGVF